MGIDLTKWKAVDRDGFMFKFSSTRAIAKKLITKLHELRRLQLTIRA